MAFTKIVGAGIHTLSNVNTHNINSSGIITATKFTGLFDGSSGDFSGNVTIDGNLTVNGTTTTLNTTLQEVDQLFVSANNSAVGAAITQSGSGDILRLYDGTSQVVTVDDKGNVLIGTSSVIDNSKLTIVKAAAGLTTAIALGNGNASGDGSKIIATKSLVLSADYDANNNAAKSYLGFETDGTEKLRITSDGKVGIRTDDPAYTLDLGKSSSSTIRLVSGNDKTAIRIGAGGNASDVTLIRVDGASANHDGESDDSANGFSFKYLGSGSGVNNRFSICPDNQAGTQFEAITVLQDGKVGIGTDDLIYRLEVFEDGGLTSTIGSASTTVRFTNKSGTGSNSDLNLTIYDKKISSVGTENWRGTEKRIEYNVDDNATKRMWIGFLNETTDASDNTIRFGEGLNTEWMRIDNGKVGIGTTNPFHTTSLDVFDSSSGTDEDLFSVRSKTGAFLVQCSDKNAANPEWRLRTFASEDLVFSPGGTGAAGEKVRIKAADGKVGIGTTNPRARLHIFDVNPVLRLTDSNQAADNQSWNISAGNTQLLRIQAINDAGTGGGNLFDFYRSTNQVNEFLGMKSGNYWFVVDNLNAKVGIGTTNPNSQLSIFSDADGEELIHFDMGSVADRRGWKFKQGDTGTSTQLVLQPDENGKVFQIKNSSDDEQFYLYTASSGSYLRLASELHISDTIQHIGDSDTKIRFPAANTISFETAGKERARIAGIGSVGIGTDDPKTKLNVYTYPSTDTGGILVQNTNYSSNEDRAYLIAGTQTWTGAATDWSTYGFQHKLKSDGSGVPRLTIDASAGGSQLKELITFMTSGRVGIGTDDPDAKLHILSGANNMLQIESTDRHCTMYLIDSIGSSFIQNDSGQLRFGVGGGASAAGGETEAVRIDSDGNVGIGTHNPLEKLDVKGHLAVGEDFAVNRPRIILSAPNESSKYHHLFGANLKIDSSETFTTPSENISGGGWLYRAANSLNSHGHMIYMSASDTNGASSTPLERLRIDASGRVLIGNDETPANAASVAIVGSYGSSSNLTPFLYLCRDENISDGIVNNEALGQILFASKDGYRGAMIEARTAGTWSSSSSDASLVFKTTPDNATVPAERVRINSSGNVGIGTANPTRQLTVLSSDVVGSTEDDRAYSARFTTRNPTSFLNLDIFDRRWKDGQSHQWQGTEKRIEYNVNGDSNKRMWMSFFNESTSTTSNTIRFGEQEDNEWMRIQDGTVGIGTTSTHGSPLYARANDASALVLERTSTNNCGIRFRNNTSSMFAGLAGNAVGFAIDDDENLGDDPMMIVRRDTGRFGIGVGDNPGYKLHVKEASINTIATFESGDGGAGILLKDDTHHTRIETTDGAFKIDVDVSNEITTASNRSLSFQINASTKLSILNSGQVNVNGNMQFTAANPEIELNNGGPRFRVPAANTLAVHSGGTLGSTNDEQLRITSGVVQLNATSNTHIRGGVYAKYQGASGSTGNLNNTTINKVSWLQTNTTIFENGGFSNDATDVTVPFDGIYMVMFNGYLESANARTNVRFRFKVNGNDETADFSLNNYIRRDSGHNESSVNLTAYLNLSANDTVAVASQKIAATGTVTLVKELSSLTFHLVA